MSEQEYVENKDETKRCCHCWKARSEGIVLRKCARCKVTQYCSKECQKAAWPIHKQRCAHDAQTNVDASPHSRACRKEVTAFIARYRQILADSGHKALALSVKSYSISKHTVFCVTLQRHPERGFVVVAADPKPLRAATELMEVDYEVMNGQLQQANEDAVGMGLLGAYFITFVVKDDDLLHTQYATIPFHAGDMDPYTPESEAVWKMQKVNLFAAINGEAWMSSVGGRAWEKVKQVRSGSG